MKIFCDTNIDKWDLPSKVSPIFFLPSRAHYKVFFRCYRCRLAKLFDYQLIAGNNEVTTVTTIEDLSKKWGYFASKKEINNCSLPDPYLFFGRETAHRSIIPGIGINHSMHRDVLSEIRGFHIPPYGTKCSMPWNIVFHPMKQTGRWHLRIEKVESLELACEMEFDMFEVLLCHG